MHPNCRRLGSYTPVTLCQVVLQSDNNTVSCHDNILHYISFPSGALNKLLNIDPTIHAH